MKMRKSKVTLLLSTIITGCTTGFQSPIAFSAQLRSPKTRTSQVWAQRQQQQDPSSNLESKLNSFLEDGNLRRAGDYIQQNPSMNLDKGQFDKIFDAVERRTIEADEKANEQSAVYQMNTSARLEMTRLYKILRDSKHLNLFGAAESQPPAAGSYIVTPNLIKDVTDLDMVALTPKSSNTFLIAGCLLALVEVLASVFLGWSFNVLVLSTLVAAIADRIAFSGAVFESFAKIFTPGIDEKIARHEAGHFLCAYLLGCPVEGCVLSTWDALKDFRYKARGQATAGTSFFDPILTTQLEKSRLSRGSIDRYSVIVMAGIAAEAMHFGQADGGAGDEASLITLLSQLNGPLGMGPWNGVSIRNQARWGALQAILLLRHYKPSYEALVETLLKGGSLGDCIYAIEKAAKDNNLQPLNQPVGYILDKGPFGEWTTERPANIPETKSNFGRVIDVDIVDKENEIKRLTESKSEPEKEPDVESSMETLKKMKQEMEQRLKEADDKLGELGDKQ